MSRLRSPSRIQSCIALIIVVAAQIVVLRMSSAVGVLALLALATVGSRVAGVSSRRVIATVYRIVLIVLPIFLVRLIVGTPLSAAMIEWTVYAGRLVTAAIIAQGYYSALGASGIFRGLSVPLRLLPRQIAYPLGHIVSSSLYLIPGVTNTIRTTFNAARVRDARDLRDRTIGIGQSASVIRTGMIALLSIPQGRAEAMVIRGLYSNAETQGAKEKEPPEIPR